MPNTNGVAIHKEIAPQQAEPIILKHTPNSFYQTNLSAKDHAIPVTVLYDACATKDLTIVGNSIPAKIVHAAYMAGLSGMFAQVMMTEQLQKLELRI